MKNLLLTLLMTCYTASPSMSEDFREDFEAALSFLSEQQSLSTKVAQYFSDNDSKEALALVAPELIRYQLFSDFFETKALELAYVRGGHQLADFSIGRFQMKPSFVEELEYHITQNPDLASRFADWTTYPTNDLTDRRQLRLQRLKQLKWQMIYAHLFLQVMKQCYPAIGQDSEQYRLAFMATAYNYGFFRPLEEIEHHMQQSSFPYGRNFEAEQYPYGQWSLHFYQQL